MNEDDYRRHQGDDQMDWLDDDYHHPDRPSPWAGLILMASLAILLVLGAMGYVGAQTPLEVKERQLLDYIEEHTGYDTTYTKGRYEFWSPERINRTFYGHRYTNQTSVLALHMQGTIILPSWFNLENDSEILLHELFHLVVFDNGVEFPCIEEEEQAAYNLQIKYVDEVGRGRKPGKLFVMLLQCNFHNY